MVSQTDVKFNHFKYPKICVCNRFPFDWKNPVGYLVAVAVQLHMTLIIVRYIECFLIFGLAGVLFGFSIANDIKNNLKQFNKIAKSKKSILPNIMEQLVALIHFDVDLRQLSQTNLN